MEIFTIENTKGCLMTKRKQKWILEEKNQTTIRSVFFLVSPFILQVFTHVTNYKVGRGFIATAAHAPQPPTNQRGTNGASKC